MIKIISILTKFIIAALVALLFSSCNHNFNFENGIKGSGNITTEIRPVGQDFKSIEVSDGIKVNVAQNDVQSIKVETDDNLQKHIITQIENGILKIKTDQSYNSSSPIVSVKMPIINGLSASSGSEIDASKKIISNNLKVKSSSGSHIDIEVEADTITLETSSGSSIDAKGKALKLETNCSSGSQIKAKDLMANDVFSQSSSGSDSSVYPILKLNAKASSGSSISYYKTPKILSKEESSGGSIHEK